MAALREGFRVEVEVWLMGHYTDSEHTWISDPADTCIREFDAVITENPSHVHTTLHMVDGQEEAVFSVAPYVNVTLVQGMVLDPGRHRELPVLSGPLSVEESFNYGGTMHITDVTFDVTERKS